MAEGTAALGIEREGAVVRLTLDLAASNDLTLWSDLAGGCRAVAEDETVLCVVITIRNSLDAIARAADANDDVEAQILLRKVQAAAVETVAGLRMPVVASISGRCDGIGLELALACDVRLAAARTTFAMPQVASGDLPFAGGTQRLPRIVGRGAALQLILLAESIDAAEAYRLGLVKSVMPADDLDAKAMALAQTAATKAPVAARHTKEAILRGMDGVLAEGLRLEADLYFLVQTTEDRSEGVRAFQERRPPQFKGR